MAGKFSSYEDYFMKRTDVDIMEEWGEWKGEWERLDPIPKESEVQSQTAEKNQEVAERRK